MLVPLIIILISIFGGFLTIFITHHHHLIQIIQDLCDLRQNFVKYYQHQLKCYTDEQVYLPKVADEIIKSVQRLIHQHKDSFELEKVRRINEELIEECSILLKENYILRDELTILREENKKIEFLTVENINLCYRNEELKMRNEELKMRNEELKMRNEELEYAINLESISMIEDLEARDILFDVFDNVRRSLNRILDPA
ncbi:MAG: hypothetical protein ACFFD2_00790 [Promethearchaeota archaeon]